MILMRFLSMLFSFSCFDYVSLCGCTECSVDDHSAMQVHVIKSTSLSGVAANASERCDPLRPPQTDPNFLSKFRPCGGYSSCRLPVAEITFGKRNYPERATLESNNFVIAANVVHPGRTLVRNQHYIVQFDIGGHGRPSSVEHSSRISDSNWPFSVCPNGPDGGECCLEAIVRGDDDWGDLGMGANYDCMGQCGPGSSGAGVINGCRPDTTRTAVVGGLDCAKHDLCSVYKSVLIGSPASGFCTDLDCGDEAAQTVFNCWSGFSSGNPGGTGTGNRICSADVNGEFNLVGAEGGAGDCRAWHGDSLGQGLVNRPYRPR